MPTDTKTRWFIAAVAWGAVAAAGASGSFMRVSVERDAIFTPGRMRVTVTLSERAELAGPYEVTLTAYLAGLKVREQTVSLSRGAAASFEIPFPRMQTRGEVRCRVELSLKGEFIEAMEQPVFLWPPAAPFDRRHRPKDVWVLDASGGLQQAFRVLDVNCVDAAFQGVRDFGLPSAVFIGEFAEMKAVQTVLDRVAQAPEQPVIVFLRQSQFPKALEVKLANDANSPRSIVCDMNTPLLRGLTHLDVSNLLPQAVGIEPNSQGGRTHAFIAGAGSPRRMFLHSLNADGRSLVFCQLPTLDPCDPRQVTVLRNLVEFSTTKEANDRSPAR
jgi:hypothetical protein